MNKTNELYRDLAMVHTVVRRIFHKFKKVMKSPIEAIDHTLQRDSRSCGVYVCYYAEKITKDEWMQLYIGFRSVRSFKTRMGLMLFMQVSFFLDTR